MTCSTESFLISRSAQAKLNLLGQRGTALLVELLCFRPGDFTSFLLDAQRFEAGDNIEQFLVDATLAQTMECPIEVL